MLQVQIEKGEIEKKGTVSDLIFILELSNKLLFISQMERSTIIQFRILQIMYNQTNILALGSSRGVI